MISLIHKIHIRMFSKHLEQLQSKKSTSCTKSLFLVSYNLCNTLQKSNLGSLIKSIQVIVTGKTVTKPDTFLISLGTESLYLLSLKIIDLHIFGETVMKNIHALFTYLLYSVVCL